MSAPSKDKSKVDRSKSEKSKSDKNKSDKGKANKAKLKSVIPIPKLNELENQFLLRMPEPFATGLYEALSNGSLKERLKIEMNADCRHAMVKFDHAVFSAKLVDLPCVVESWKTFDKKSLWKTGNICQVLICHDPDEPNSESEDEEPLTKADQIRKQQLQNKRLQYPHGITPPLKNVRKRRFRKTARKKYVDPPEVEIEVKRLLRADVNAIDVKFEVENEETEKQDHEEEHEEVDEIEMDIDVGGPHLDHFNENSNMSGMVSSDNEHPNASAEILPDISSSDDDGDDDFGGNQASVSTSSQSLSSSQQSGSKETLSSLQEQLSDILDKKAEQEMRIERASNPLLKQRFQSGLDELLIKEDIIKKEMQKLM